MKMIVCEIEVIAAGVDVKRRAVKALFHSFGARSWS